ncbi:4Fe-4S binding protein [Desulfurivibrio dismutans]|uniref:4Fe-4S binding protein n=1 Tax=Desulfurivibrio dismutans TaxID=1398908 RepID=UPI0023DC5952|nr:4Fe-4S binding protein [Desulfurivibrio alkaliphilus]MDF1615465.1 4Fe-4S binding protein [Desulfurivibrio alkaliphilus]
MTLADRLLARIARPGTTVDFTGARCLRRRFIRSGCDLCARACRPQAIYPGEGEVRLESGRCTGCLVCTAVCPTEALTGRDSRLAKAGPKIATGDGEVVLCCEKSLRHGTEIILPCLGALSRDHLAAYALLRGRLTLLLYPCRECHSPWVPDVLQEQLDELHQQWQGLDHQPVIHLHLEAKPPAPAHPDPVSDQRRNTDQERAPGRRDFFRAFKEVSFHAAAETWTTLREEEQQEEQWAASKHLPGRLRLLQQAGERNADHTPLLTALLVELTVGPECTFCGACIGLCPSGAISGDDDLQRLDFIPLSCSACGLCREFCPARAISIKPLSPGGAADAGEKRLLRERAAAQE